MATQKDAKCEMQRMQRAECKGPDPLYSSLYTLCEFGHGLKWPVSKGSWGVDRFGTLRVRPTSRQRLPSGEARAVERVGQVFVCPARAQNLSSPVFSRLQTAGVMLLLVLVSVLGQIGIRQCLRTGEVTYAFNVVEECEDSCCKTHGEGPQHNELPAPCDDGSCCLLIALIAVDPFAIPVPTSAPVSPCLPTLASLDHLAPRVSAELQFSQDRPPDRQAVPLTVLFSSFLI